MFKLMGKRSHDLNISEIPAKKGNHKESKPDAFIAKPFDPPVFLEMIEELLGK